jgi:hypothetical protein
MYSISSSPSLHIISRSLSLHLLILPTLPPTPTRHRPLLALSPSVSNSLSPYLSTVCGPACVYGLDLSACCHLVSPQ